METIKKLLKNLGFVLTDEAEKIEIEAKVEEGKDTYFRFMSQEEFEKLSCGMELVNRKDHGCFCKTESIGFCFMRTIDCPAENSIAFLRGIVDDDFVVEFEATAELLESYGIYSVPDGGYYDTFRMREYCIKTYSIDTMIPVRYGFVDRYEETIEWYQWNH